MHKTILILNSIFGGAFMLLDLFSFKSSFFKCVDLFLQPEWIQHIMYSSVNYNQKYHCGPHLALDIILRLVHVLVSWILSATWRWILVTPRILFILVPVSKRWLVFWVFCFTICRRRYGNMKDNPWYIVN